MIKKLFSNKYFILLLAITILLIITMIFNANKSYETKQSDNIITKITLPVQKSVYAISSNIRGFFTHFGDIAKLNEENTRLKNKISQLESTIDRNNAYKTENERLRSLLGLKETYKDFEYKAANVISKDSSKWFLSVTLDKGSDDGIKIHDTVVTYDGLVGHVSDIGTNWSRVTTILDSQSTVAAIVDRTNELATIDGDIDLSQDGLCKMTYISKDSTIIVGDIAKTSGLGGVYPKGLNVGKITEIHSDNKGVSQYAVISPSVDFDKMYEVLIITN